MITGFYTAIAALMMLGLAKNVIALRRTKLVGIGDGGDDSLARAIRIHANFTEYVPVGLLLLLLVELNGSHPLLVHGLGSLLIVCRLLHMQGLRSSSGKSFGRFWGTLGTWIVIVVSAVLLIGQYIAGLLG